MISNQKGWAGASSELHCCVKELPLGQCGGTVMLYSHGVWPELCSRKVTGVMLMRVWTKGTHCEWDEKEGTDKSEEELSENSMFLTWVDLATFQQIQKTQIEAAGAGEDIIVHFVYCGFPGTGRTLVVSSQQPADSEA